MLDVVDEVLAEDYVGHIPAMPEPVRGTEGFKRLIVTYRTAYPDVHVTGISIFRIKDGKVTEEWEGFDTLSMMQQLGVLEPGTA